MKSLKKLIALVVAAHGKLWLFVWFFVHVVFLSMVTGVTFADELLISEHLPFAHSAKGKAFIKNVAGEVGYSTKELTDIFTQVYRNDAILKKISHPAEKKMPWHKYRRIFLDEKRILNGARFYRQHKAVLDYASATYGVPASIIVAILGVETRYGTVMGNDKVIEALTTIAFEYPQRESFFTKELRAFLTMTFKEHINPLEPIGSYAGAMGMAQFMPSSYLHYAVDYEGDGHIDLWHNPHDAIVSIAHYLSKNGWVRNGPLVEKAVFMTPYAGTINHKPFTTVAGLQKHGLISARDGRQKAGVLRLAGDGSDSDASSDASLWFVTFKNFSVITTYNTSPLYAMAVLELSQAIEHYIEKISQK